MQSTLSHGAIKPCSYKSQSTKLHVTKNAAVTILSYQQGGEKAVVFFTLTVFCLIFAVSILLSVFVHRL